MRACRGGAESSLELSELVRNSDSPYKLDLYEGLAEKRMTAGSV